MTQKREPQPSVTGTSRKNISDRALDIASEGAKTNSTGENTVTVVKSRGETTVYRIFRQKHLDGCPLDAADRWIRSVKAQCVSILRDLEVVAVWTSADGGSVLVVITGLGIIGREKAGMAT